MANELLGKTPADTYKDILHLGTATGSTPGTGLPATTGQIVYDGAGVASKLKLSQSKIEADNIFITNGTISSLSAPITVAQGGTGGTTTSGVKALWAIDKVENTALSTWAGSTNITTLGIITTGSWGGTTIPVSKGGTGATTASAAVAALGLGNVDNVSINTWTGSANITTLGTIGSGTWNGATIPTAYGGTGSATVVGARTNLGLGDMAQQSKASVAITGGTIDAVTMTNSTFTNPTVSAMTSIEVGSVSISSATIEHTTAASFITIPNILNTSIVSDNLEGKKLTIAKTSSSTTNPAVSISQYLTDSAHLLVITNSDIISTYKVSSTGTINGTQLTSSTDHISLRTASESVNFGSTSQYSVASGSLDTIQSHDSKFITGNVAVGDVIRIKASAGGTWEVREIKSITSSDYLVLTSPLSNTYTNTTYFERISSDATEKFSVENNGTMNIAGGAHDSGHIILGAYHIWVDSTGDLRIKNGPPTSDTDGSVVGTQS